MKKKLIFRFDDIHPLMNKDSFEFILSLSNICAKSIMLCVIPNNKDKSLINSNSPIPDFWEKLVLIESKGVTIGLHGLEHNLKLCKTSLLSVSKQSEYTGLEYSNQKLMLKKGLSILESRGLTPKFFAAPAHGFDKATLKALKDINFKNISDGFYRNVCIKKGLTWIPLKTWNPKTRFIGNFNTVCIHLNKDNIKKISEAIREIIAQGKTTDFQTLISSAKPYSYFDGFSQLIYTFLIKILFFKRSILKCFAFRN